MPWNWGPGFVTYASESPRCYSFGTSWVHPPLYNDYLAIKYYIDTYRPIGIMFWYTGGGEYNYHYVAVRGYWFDESGKDFIINDCWGGVDFVSWDIYYGAMSVHLLYPN